MVRLKASHPPANARCCRLLRTEAHETHRHKFMASQIFWQSRRHPLQTEWLNPLGDEARSSSFCDSNRLIFNGLRTTGIFSSGIRRMTTRQCKQCTRATPESLGKRLTRIGSQLPKSREAPLTEEGAELVRSRQDTLAMKIEGIKLCQLSARLGQKLALQTQGSCRHFTQLIDNK